MHPADKKFIVVAHRGQFWIDHAVPFGLSSAAGLQGEVADAVMAIWSAIGVKPSSKWVDDVVLFRFPCVEMDTLPTRVDQTPNSESSSSGSRTVYAYDRALAKALIACLGVPWHLLKGQDFDVLFLYVGFLWDCALKRVCLTDEKLIRMLQRIDSFINDNYRRPCHLKDVLRIHGSLSHITFIYPHGAAHLTSLSSFMASFGNSPHSNVRPRFAPPSLWSDLRWWKELLLEGPQPRSLVPLGPTLDIGIWVDASTNWGVGLVWDNHECGAWRWLPGWNHAPGCDIGWGEAIAVELAIVLMDRLGLKDRRVLIRSDNMGVIGAFQKRRSRNWMVNQCIRRSNIISMARNLDFEFMYVSSEENLADPVSRGVKVPSFVPLHLSVPLPGAIFPYLAFYV